MTIKITGIFDIPDWDIEEFDEVFGGFKEEFPNAEFKYEIISKTTIQN